MCFITNTWNNIHLSVILNWFSVKSNVLSFLSKVSWVFCWKYLSRKSDVTYSLPVVFVFVLGSFELKYKVVLSFPILCINISQFFDSKFCKNLGLLLFSVSVRIVWYIAPWIPTYFCSIVQKLLVFERVRSLFCVQLFITKLVPTSFYTRLWGFVNCVIKPPDCCL
jgi:hypothetical protein